LKQSITICRCECAVVVGRALTTEEWEPETAVANLGADDLAR